MMASGIVDTSFKGSSQKEGAKGKERTSHDLKVQEQAVEKENKDESSLSPR